MGRYLELARKAVEAPPKLPQPGSFGFVSPPPQDSASIYSSSAVQAQPAPTPPTDLAAILNLPLSDFAVRHLALRIKLPDGSMCWFCSGANEVAVLRGEGVERGAIWAARELGDVLGAGWTRETIGRLIAVKCEFGGTIAPQDGTQNVEGTS